MVSIETLEVYDGCEDFYLTFLYLTLFVASSAFSMLSVVGVNTEMLPFYVMCLESVLFSDKHMTVFICWMRKLLITNYWMVWLLPGVTVCMIISMRKLVAFPQYCTLQYLIANTTHSVSKVVDVRPIVGLFCLYTPHWQDVLFREAECRDRCF